MNNKRTLIIGLVSVIVVVIVILIFGNNKTLSKVCTASGNDKLEIVLENKEEIITALGGDGKGYNVSNSVTTEYDDGLLDRELFTMDLDGNLYVVFDNKLYFSNDEKIIAKYCDDSTCYYDKLDEDNIKDFEVIKSNLKVSTIGVYNNGGSGKTYVYAITEDGQVVSITDDNECSIIYDDKENPIDRIFYLNFYDGLEYTILLKDGRLVTRTVDRENLVELDK